MEVANNAVAVADQAPPAQLGGYGPDEDEDSDYEVRLTWSFYDSRTGAGPFGHGLRPCMFVQSVLLLLCIQSRFDSRAQDISIPSVQYKLVLVVNMELKMGKGKVCK